MSARRRLKDSLDIVRQRLIHETEIALHYGLRFPERHVSIPAVRAGTATFDPEFAEAFWNEALGLSDG